MKVLTSTSKIMSAEMMHKCRTDTAGCSFPLQAGSMSTSSSLNRQPEVWVDGQVGRLSVRLKKPIHHFAVMETASLSVNDQGI